MSINFGSASIILFLMLILIIFCTFFSSKLAQLKNRSRAWGLLGFFFNIPGFIIVCFLPSKRKDNMQTNPIAYAVSKLPSLSRKTIGLLIGLAAAAILTIIAYDNIPVIIQNYKYSKQVLSQSESEYEQPRLIEAQISKIFAGSDSTFAISENGDVYCWGRQLSPPLEGQQRGVIYNNAKKAAATENVLFILTNDNLLYACGNNVNHQLLSDEAYISEFKLIADNVMDFAISETTVGYIKTNGKLYMYGDNSYGQLGTYDKLSRSEPKAVLGNVKKVICEASYTLALQESGTAVAFGNNVNGQFACSESSVTSPIELCKGVIDIAAGDDFILLLKDNGELLSCGGNSCGQLGYNSDQHTLEFTTVLTDISAIAGGKKSAFALNSNGELYAWGQNNVGQLGNGSTENITTPEIVAKDVISVSTSGLHTLILTSNGKINACGYNSLKQLGKSTSKSTFEAVVSIK